MPTISLYKKHARSISSFNPVGVCPLTGFNTLCTFVAFACFGLFEFFSVQTNTATFWTKNLLLFVLRN